MIATLTGMQYFAIWRDAYREYEILERISLLAKTKATGLDKLTWIEQYGKIGVLHHILRKTHISSCTKTRDISLVPR